MLRVLMAPARRTVRVGLAGLLTTLVAGLAACGGGSKAPSSSPTSSPSPSTAATSAEAEAAAKALAAYQGYIETLNKDSKTANYQDPDLRKYIGDPLLGDTIDALAQMNEAGLVGTGATQNSPKIVEVKLDQPVKTVIIGDCVDSSNVGLAYKTSGSPAPLVSTDASRRIKMTAEAVLYDDGRWLVRKSTPVEGATC